MGIINCKMCGSNAMTLQKGTGLAVCGSCGSIQPVSSAAEEKITELYNTANNLRIKADFDGAAGFYDMILNECPRESEAYWGLCLCRYGIEYVESTPGGTRKPTVHRASYGRLRRDALYEAALDYAADDEVKSWYQDEAKEIDRILGGILAVSREEKPYDIFICYKETDENGNRTPDSLLAQDIYSKLTDKGYRVFFSRITLKEKLGSQYEPYIFAALNSAKLMLAVGTDIKYLNAQWVKNEWSRFMKLMAEDKTKLVVPCYKDMPSGELPEEFRGLEGQNLGVLGAMQDLLIFIDRFFGRDEKAEYDGSDGRVRADAPGIESLLGRAFMLLQDGKFEEADEYCDRALDLDVENPDATLCKLLAEQKKSQIGQLRECRLPFDETAACKKVMRRCDKETVNQLKEINAFIRERNDTAEKQRVYNKAKAIFDSAKKEEDYLSAIAEFEKIKDFEDSEVLIGECRKGIEKNKEKTEKEKEKRKEAAEKREREKNHENFQVLLWEKIIVCGIIAAVIAIIVGAVKIRKYEYKLGKNVVAVSRSEYTTVVLKSNGKVDALKISDNDLFYGQTSFRSWRNITAVSAGAYHTVGIKEDGTVVACGDNTYGQCNVGEWHDIVAVSAGGYHTVGLKSDGTVVACGANEDGRCDVGKWTDIVAVDANVCHTVGVKSDGTVVACGQNEDGRCDVGEWTDIVAVSAGLYHTVGLKSDGRVVACGKNKEGQCDVSGWMNIIAVAAGSTHTVGLKSGGTVVVCGKDDFDGRCKVSGWTDIAAIDASSAKTVGLKTDGKVISTPKHKK